MAEYRQKKIALIGATGYEYSSTEAQVECFTWDRLKKVANLADYDVVILDLLSLEDPRSLDTRAFMDMLNVRTMWEVLDKGPGARIVQYTFWVIQGFSSKRPRPVVLAKFGSGGRFRFCSGPV